MFSWRMGGREWMMARNPGEERVACAHTGSATCGSLVQTLVLEPTYVLVALRRLDLLYIPFDSIVTVNPTSWQALAPRHL